MFRSRSLSTAPEIQGSNLRLSRLEEAVYLGLDSLTELFRANLKQVGGAISPSTMQAVDLLLKSGRRNGWLSEDTKLLWLIVGDSISRRVAIIGGGLHNQVSLFGNFSVDSELHGLKPVSANRDNYADLGVDLGGSQSVTLAVDVLEGGEIARDKGALIGAYALNQDGFGTYLMFNNFYGDPPELNFSIAGDQDLRHPCADKGLYLGTANTSKEIWLDGALLATSGLESGEPTVRYGNFRGWSSGEYGLPSSARIGMFAVWNSALDAELVAAFSADMDEFNQLIGRS